MIQILGSNEGAEYEAACDLRKLILEEWPWVGGDPAADITIIAGVKCHGQSVRDLDLVVYGRLPGSYQYRPFLGFSNENGAVIKPEAVYVRSFFIVVEVKDQDVSNVRFTGTRVDVRYRQNGKDTWHSASDQNEKQKYSLLRYLQNNLIPTPYITNLIWLRNVPNVDLPRRPHNIIGGMSGWHLILNVVGQLCRPRFIEGKWSIEAWRDSSRGMKSIFELLSKTVEPSRLDRLKIERICQAAIDPRWMSNLGKRQLIFRGRGGTGKTVILLQMAWRAYSEQQSRTLILTYNKALTADLARLFTLMGLSDDIGSHTVQIQTVHSFFYSAFQGLGLMYDEDDFLLHYDSIKKRAMEYIRAGVITRLDITELIEERTGAFSWDYVFIDEAQDWPEDERDLLRFLYKPSCFVVADGVDQLVRRPASCNWKDGLPSPDSRIISLSRGLRMKASLARFTTQLAATLGLSQWRVEPNDLASGGRVIVLEGDYFDNPEFHKELTVRNENDGNQPVDMLVCVPPELANSVDSSGRSLADLFCYHGPVWDGTSVDIRASYPTSVKQLRIVQYDSCRGLEGWTIINLALDSFYEYKRNMWQYERSTSLGAFPDDPLLPHLYASRWLMIPMTRAIDTLVIQVGVKPSALKDALRIVADLCPDVVEWVQKRE